MIIACGLPLLTHAQKRSQNIVIPTYERCKEKWDYVFVKDTIRGEVLFYEKAPFACGNISTASITLVKTNKNDSIRIIQACDLTNNFSKGQQVIFVPDYNYYPNISLPFNTSRSDCMIKRTCYGKCIVK